MRLLLTSTGLSNPELKRFFVSRFDRLDDKTASIVTAGRSQEERKYIDESICEMTDLGIEVIELDVSDTDRFENIRSTDIYYVCGGNTYFIMDRMRKTGIDTMLIEAVRNGKFYIGVSAGSIIAGPDIDIARLGDENDVGLHDMSGLGLADCVISPHFSESERKALESFESEHQSEHIIAISDDEAVFVEDGKMTMIYGTL
ncbi:MAG: type 1 glutamine amidotransferase-like domain-containing protein [Candidatus Moranbacteria bacterium]|nr:type 1 glutamine amidotransferase-like domain-containing protein [Candidatus Moranbacteria bacterium]